MLILQILLVLFALFLIFFLGPAIVAVFKIFNRASVIELDSACESEQFAPYADQMRASVAALQAYQPVRVAIKARDGVRLCADYYDRHAEKTVIFVHGYRASPLMNFSVQGELFASRGWNVLMIRHRAHGDSEGKHCCLGLKEQYDVLSWADWASNCSGVRTLVLYGMSMGAAAVAYASDKLDPKTVRALILDCGYVSPYDQIRRDCIRRRVPWRILMLLIRPLAYLRCRVDIRVPVSTSLYRTKIPAFFLHGTADVTVPIEQGLANYEACASVKAFFTAEGAGHTQSFLAEREEATTALFAFLQTNIPE